MNPQGSSPEPASFGRPRGFVLVSVLLIVALATILVVVTSMMAQIERKAAANGAKIEQARANALFALDIAMNQLQREAGPDQRITARADILDTSSTAVSTNTVKQPLWTGTWKTFNPAATNQALDDPAGSSTNTSYLRNWSVGSGATTPQAKARNANMAWLVSGATNNTALNPVDWTANATNSVLLAAGVGNTTVDVNAPLVAMTSTPPGYSSPQTVGKYAYWVADEGIKARVNLVDATLGAPPGSVTEQLHYLAPQANAIHKIAGLMSSSSADFRTANSPEALQKLNTPASLLCLGTTPPSLNIKAYSPDITTYSSSVLADVRHGGLKKDLTAALESPDEFDRLMAYMREETKGVDALGSLTRETAGRETVKNWWVRWQSLYHFYNLYKSSYSVYDYTNGVKGSLTPSKVPGLGSPSATSLPMRYYGYENGLNDNRLYDPLMPVQLSLTAYVGLTSKVVPTPAENNPSTGLPYPAPGAGQNYYKLRVHNVPQLILYNPYNATLTSPVANFQFTANAPLFFTSVASSSSQKWTIKVGAQTVQTSKMMAWDGTPNAVGPPAVDNSSSGGVFTVTTSTSANMTFAPGQMKVFGLASVPSAPTPIANLPMVTNLTNDWVAGVGQYAYVKADSGSDWVALCNDSDALTVTFDAGTRLRANGNKLDWNQDGSRDTLRNSICFPKRWTTSIPMGQNLMDVQLSTTTAPQTLGTISNVVSSSNRLNTSSAQLSIRMRGARSADGFNLPVFSSNRKISNFFYPYNRDSYVQEMTFGSTATTTGSAPPENTVHISVAGEPESVWGKFSAGANANDQSRVILKEIPRHPLVSLGQFQHMNPSSLTPNSATEGIANSPGTVLYPVGGSLAQEDSDTRNPGDDNFLANEALFDRFFLSTVPNTYQDSNAANYYPFQSFNSAYIAAGGGLPNNRMSYYKGNGTSPTVSQLRTYDQAAAKLMLNGGFNVNSTSVDAWRTFLASVSGVALTTGVVASDSAYLRNASLTSEVSGTAAWGVGAKLTDAQITELATRIVAEVKSRGPFLSLGDFLNRRLGANTDEKARRGALQAAIDNSTINSALTSIGATAVTTTPTTISNTTRTAPNLQEATGIYPNTAKGIPGWLMQGDLVQALAPAMTARSDTFVIRIYGEAVNPKTHATEATAYGEAVVQRIPDFVDSSDSAELWDDPVTSVATDTTQATYKINATNQAFGRRFKVTSFRWLNQNEI